METTNFQTFLACRVSGVPKPNVKRLKTKSYKCTILNFTINHLSQNFKKSKIVYKQNVTLIHMFSLFHSF